MRGVVVISKTHSSCQNFGGAVTADRWCRQVRAGRMHAKTVVVEEISQINAYLWNSIAKAALAGVQFILLGDFRQLDAVRDTWCGGSVPALEHSSLLCELVWGCRLTLTENRRSDAALFSFYTGLFEPRGLNCDTDHLQEVLAEARALFPRQPGHPHFTLTISHQRRMAQNRAQNLAEKTADAVYYRVRAGKRGENNPQHFWAYPGQVLVGAGGKVRRGVFVTVLAATEEGLVVDNGGPQTLDRETACSCLRLSHSLTYAAVQGLTLQGRVRLETDSPELTIKHLYVGASRCTAFGLLEVC